MKVLQFEQAQTMCHANKREQFQNNTKVIASLYILNTCAIRTLVQSEHLCKHDDLPNSLNVTNTPNTCEARRLAKELSNKKHEHLRNVMTAKELQNKNRRS